MRYICIRAKPTPIQKEFKKQIRFDYPMASKKDQSEATTRILKILNKVNNLVHFNLQGQRRTDTLCLPSSSAAASPMPLASCSGTGGQRY
jgi:hypothetical protein